MAKQRVVDRLLVVLTAVAVAGFASGVFKPNVVRSDEVESKCKTPSSCEPGAYVCKASCPKDEPCSCTITEPE